MVDETAPSAYNKHCSILNVESEMNEIIGHHHNPPSIRTNICNHLLSGLLLTLVWLESTKMVVLVSPTPDSIGGARTASRNVFEAVSDSSLSVTPVSTNCLTPGDTREPILNIGDETE